MAESEASGPNKEVCEECGEVRTICPVCNKPTTQAKHVKNGQWAVAAIEVDSPDHFCAEWGSEHLWVYFHNNDD